MRDEESSSGILAINKAYAWGRYPQKLGPGVVKMKQNH